jgi:protein-tyrosine phosphatase
MPLRHQLRSFWWFIEGRVGGMGRLGFNRCHWFDLSFEEGEVLSWLGKQHVSTSALADLWSYLEHHGAKAATFYGLRLEEATDRLQRLRDRDALLAVLQSIHAKTDISADLAWVDENAQPALRLMTSAQRRQHEVTLLKQHNVGVLISLLEQPLDHPELLNDFEVFHVPVEDIAPPNRAQVYAFAETLVTSLAAGKTVVTHCLAGIGRTTTMLMAAYLVQGYALQDLTAWVRVRNPHYLFHGSQMRFLQELAEDVGKGRLPVLAPGRHLLRCQ